MNRICIGLLTKLVFQNQRMDFSKKFQTNSTANIMCQVLIKILFQLNYITISETKE